MLDSETTTFGHKDSSFKAAGKEDGIRKLCEDFYNIMSTDPKAKHIRNMHKDDLNTMIDKLTTFLTMWLGGPQTYREKYWKGGMPMVHKHLIINQEEKDTWLYCMDNALDLQKFSPEFKKYFAAQIRFPANMIERVARSE